jgi:phosphoribosylglycinamide formyltransferase-1
VKIGVLISGRGSNLQSLIDAASQPGYPAEIALVISNVPDVEGLRRAERAGIPTRTVSHKSYSTKADFEDALHTELVAAGVELVCLAGFMRLLTEGFVSRWHDKLINIHPSLLPAFKGLDTHQRALDAGVRFSGCTVHFVRPAMDDGPIIVQAAVPILAGDDERSLTARVLAEEHRIYPLAVKLIAQGRARVEGERVIVADAIAPASAMINPNG